MTVMVELVLPTVPTAETPVGGGGTEGGGGGGGGTGRKNWLIPTLLVFMYIQDWCLFHYNYHVTVC